MSGNPPWTLFWQEPGADPNPDDPMGEYYAVPFIEGQEILADRKRFAMAQEAAAYALKYFEDDATIDKYPECEQLIEAIEKLRKVIE